MINTFVDEIIKLNVSKETTKYKTDELIFFEDQPCEFVSIIVKGSIYMSSSFNDREINFNYLKKGSIFGHNLIFSQNNKYKAHIIASGNTEILNINKQDFLKTLQNLNILEKYLSHIAQFTIEDKETIKILQMQKLRDRIMYLLEKNKGVYRFKSVSNFAIKVGVSRETLSRELTNMEEKYLIKRTSNVIRIIK